jgi:hypothetical protein
MSELPMSELPMSELPMSELPGEAVILALESSADQASAAILCAAGQRWL